MDVPDRVFVDTGMWYCGFAEKEELSKILFTVIYRDTKTKYPYIKRSRIEGYILNRDYVFAPDNTEVLFVSTKAKFSFTVTYAPKPRIKKTEDVFKAEEFAEKGLKTLGVRLAVREALSAGEAAEKKSLIKKAGEKKASAEKKTADGTEKGSAKKETENKKPAASSKTASGKKTGSEKPAKASSKKAEPKKTGKAKK